MTPLAERMRPQTLAAYVGQQHLVGEGAVLRQAIERGKIPSFILWGPPGVGKTTLAQLIAKLLNKPFFQLSAINAGVKDIREAIESASPPQPPRWGGEQTGLFAQESPIEGHSAFSKKSKSGANSPPPGGLGGATLLQAKSRAKNAAARSDWRFLVGMAEVVRWLMEQR